MPDTDRPAAIHVGIGCEIFVVAAAPPCPGPHRAPAVGSRRADLIRRLDAFGALAFAVGIEIAGKEGRDAIARRQYLRDRPLPGLDATRRRGRTVLDDPLPRSEEHTSELQSLMRISYAVFCLKKKNRIKLNITEHNERNMSDTLHKR